MCCTSLLSINQLNVGGLLPKTIFDIRRADLESCFLTIIIEKKSEPAEWE